jgi:glycosyltransferase involved in cell wall biosynthesis
MQSRHSGKEAVRVTEPSGLPTDETGRESRPLKLLVSIPALDEQETVADVIRGIPREIPGVAEVEVVVVDDGSRDETAARATAVGARVIHHTRSRGVGAAFHSAVAYGIEAGADLVVSIDADGQFDPADIPTLVAPVVNGEADFTTASRFIDPALIPDMPGIKIWGNRIIARLISSLAGQTFHDVSCGLRCYNRRALLQLHLLARFTYTQEVILNLAFKNLRIVEVPIRVRGEREFGESRVANSVWRYGVRTAQIIFRCYRDYHPLRFFGGAALLLLAPALALGIFLLGHYLATGGFSPHKWAGFSAITLVALAVLMLQIGVIGDMLNRHRVYLEEILFRQRRETRGDAEER